MSDLLRNAHYFLSNVGWRDLLDVVVVALLLYQLLKLIRGTQAVQLLLGLGVIFAVGFTAQALHLHLLEFIFQNGTQAIVIAAIVLFQPELRRALDQVGRLGAFRTLFGQHASAAVSHVVEEVLRAGQSLSEKRTGALVVFERSTGLENIAATGVHINGEVTAEMLATLFVPGSPLHDGAVIIRGDSIIGAGCILPLSQAPIEDRSLGTRHRAALGVSEETDALVVVVSEESGAISVATGARLLRNLTPTQLRDLLGGRLPRSTADQAIVAA